MYKAIAESCGGDVTTTPSGPKITSTPGTAMLILFSILLLILFLHIRNRYKCELQTSSLFFPGNGNDNDNFTTNNTVQHGNPD